jgi:exodeoxyribonuclease-5
VQSLGGYAGTGKTTVVRELSERLPDFAVCAFTGKAASVLRRKGVAASTIHSLIFRPVDESWWQDDKGRWQYRLVFEQKDPCEVECPGFLVDEASMVGASLFDALCSYDRPVIFVGDHGQLPPVADGVVNLMQAPDVTLETIHRNAGEVAHFAEFVRQGNRPGWWPRAPGATGEQVRLARFGDLPPVPEQVICAFNRTRVGMNRRARLALGYPPDRPVAGDRVMCLQNSNVGVYNGMQGVIQSVEGEDRMVFATDDRDYEVRFLPGQFNSVERPQGRDPEGRLPFDYCYAVTCHKAQGDEWDDVVVLEERCSRWDHARWAYTAASRARRSLTWVEV